MKYSWWGLSCYWMLLTCILVISSLCETKECGFQGVDLQQCLNQGAQTSSAAACCKSLNQAIQLGYYCICKLIGSTTPLLTNSLLLPMPNCFISIPPLNQCQEPEPPHSPPHEMKVPVPVSPPEWQMQPSVPKLNHTPLATTSSVLKPSQPALGDPQNGLLTSSAGNSIGIWLHTATLLFLHLFLAST